IGSGQRGHDHGSLPRQRVLQILQEGSRQPIGDPMRGWFANLWRRYRPATLWRRWRAEATRRRHVKAGYVEVVFDLTGGERSLPETLGDPPQDLCEWMWAEPAGAGLFRLSNTPFYAYGVSLGDVVSVSQVDGLPVVDHIAERGGRSTYRLIKAASLA